MGDTFCSNSTMGPSLRHSSASWYRVNRHAIHNTRIDISAAGYPVVSNNGQRALSNPLTCMVAYINHTVHFEWCYCCMESMGPAKRQPQVGFSTNYTLVWLSRYVAGDASGNGNSYNSVDIASTLITMGFAVAFWWKNSWGFQSFASRVQLTGFVLSLATNVTATTLIGYTAWYIWLFSSNLHALILFRQEKSSISESQSPSLKCGSKDSECSCPFARVWDLILCLLGALSRAFIWPPFLTALALHRYFWSLLNLRGHQAPRSLLTLPSLWMLEFI